MTGEVSSEVGRVKRARHEWYGNDKISKWDVSSVQDMCNMFDGATSFNSDSDICELDVLNVLVMSDISGMYDSDISKW